MSAIQATEEAGTLRLAWDNRTVRKDGCAFWGLLAFWLIWAPATVIATVMALTGSDAACFLGFWSLFAWFGTLLVARTLLMRRWSEWVELSAEAVTVRAVGPLAPRPRVYPVAAIREITLNWYQEYSMVTLNIIRDSTPPRPWAMFGYWLAPALKRQVFDVMRAFAEARAVPLRFAVYGTPPDAGR